ncbi:MAG: hypothetical protein M1480_15105 [Bacteroidetes bacterium]|nr:hypothetical protein [Bacteroidota bacterium]
MGKGVLIVVLGMSIIISLLIVSLNANNTQGSKATVDYFNKTQARLISNSGIEVYLEKLRRDKTLTGSFLGNSLMNGTYDIYISGPDTALTIRSIGYFGGDSHTTVITARRYPISLPNINSALYISASNLNIKLSGNIDINGNDHNMDGTAGPNPPLPGIGVPNASDSTFVTDDLKPNINNAIQGKGGAPSISTVADTTNWENITQNCIFAADTTVTSGTYSSGTFGTIGTPIITYVNGDVQLSGTASGYGIMVVNGDLTMSGNFTFYGIIIAYGQSLITTNTVGSAGVYGGSIFVGQSINFKASGSALFYYSSQAINNAKTNLKSSRFKVLSWWE